MTPIRLSREDLEGEVSWEVNGQSPANSPQATMQFVQMLLPVASDPMLAQVSGLSLYQLLRVALRNGPLKNAKGVQAGEEEMIARTQAAQASAMSGGVPPMVGEPSSMGGGGIPPGPAQG